MAKVTLTSKTSAMKSKSTFSIILLAILFASCTTAYKSGQTPDDVYYSPARPQDEYVRTEKQDDSRYRYDDEESYRDDRYLRMKIHDRRYSGLYDDYYSYNPYYYHYYNGRLNYNSPWSSYNYWNYYYNPYYAPVITVVPRTPVYNKPRTFDLSLYNPQPTNNNPKGVRNTYTTPNNTGNNNSNNYRNSGRDAGSFLRDVFSGSSSNNNSSNSSSSSNTRSSSSSSSSSSSNSSSGSSSNAPARRF
jgi:hypothetical protein